MPAEQGGLEMAFGGHGKFGRSVPVGLLIASIVTVAGWAAERPSPTGGDAFAQSALPQDFLDPKFLDYSKLKTDFSHSSPNFSAPPAAVPSEKGPSFDLKTDYDFDVEKFLPADRFPQRGLVGNGTPQTGGPLKKKLFFMGLSVSKPLN